MNSIFNGLDLYDDDELVEIPVKDLKAFKDAIKDVCKSYECYAAINKPEVEWDEYDYMMFPKWITMLDLLGETV